MQTWLGDAQIGDHVTIRERCVSGNYGIYELTSIPGIPGAIQSWGLTFLSGMNTSLMTYPAKYIIGYTQIGPTGAQGETGTAGATGVAGPTGSQGEQGEDSAVPGPAGAQGETGPAGATGVAGPTGPPGSQGAPGNDGQDGENGLAGENGLSAYEIWINAGNTGTEADFLASLTGPQGEQGPQGVQGTAGQDVTPAIETSDYIVCSNELCVNDYLLNNWKLFGGVSIDESRGGTGGNTFSRNWRQALVFSTDFTTNQIIDYKIALNTSDVNVLISQGYQPYGKLSYGGACFPKDTQALYNTMLENGTICEVLGATISERNKMRKNEDS
jgi:hypothetical protein